MCDLGEEFSMLSADILGEDIEALQFDAALCTFCHVTKDAMNQ